MKTKLAEIGLPLLVVSALALAFYFRPAGHDPERQKLVEAVRRADYAFGQYLNADYETAKAAALDLVNYLDRMSAESARPDRNPAAVDAMTWYVRLARLEESNNGGGRQYMLEACSRCEKAGWADCSEGELRRQVERLDAIAIEKLGTR